MKKIAPSLLAFGMLLSSCTSYKNVGVWMDSQKLPALTSVGSSESVMVSVQSESDIIGLPEKGLLADKSGYVVPLPFVGFFGKKLTLKPGETSLQDPLVENLKTAVENELNMAKLSPSEKYTLNIKVDSSNFKFRYNNKGYVVVVLIVTFGHKKEWCTPTDLGLSVSYELKQGDKVVQTGELNKSLHSDEKITATYQPGFYDPYFGDDTKSPSQHAVTTHYNFAFGGAISTMQNGLSYSYNQYNKLIVETAKDITGQVTPAIK
jgi:hypothetical protein